MDKIEKILKEPKEINAEFIRKQIKELANRDLIPIGQLVIFFHAAHGLGLNWPDKDDSCEIRNYIMLRSLMPHIQIDLLNSIFCGSLKPSEFIHPFEKHYSIPGYLDIEVLPNFFRTTDKLSKDILNINKDSGADFLSFIYIYFLVCHPFIDWNGRVARSLLDYYNIKLNFTLADVWNNTESQKTKFSEEPFHKKAFNCFYSCEVHLNEMDYATISSLPMSTSTKFEITKLADYLIKWAREVDSGTALSSYDSVRIMANGIRDLHRNKVQE